MPHTIGFATDPIDLLDKLRIWLLSCGFTLSDYSAVGNGYRLHMHKNGQYVNLRSYSNEYPETYINNSALNRYGIAFNIGTGYSSGSSWAYQPGTVKAADNTSCNGVALVLGAGPYTSHQFFEDGQGNVTIIVETSPGAFKTACWGPTADKSGAGTWTGGAFFGGPKTFGHWNAFDADMDSSKNRSPFNTGASFIRADVDTFTNRWVGMSAAPGGDINYLQTGKLGTAGFNGVDDNSWTEPPIYARRFLAHLYNLQDSRAVLMPIPVFAKRDLGGVSFLGTIPSLALSAASSHGISVGQDITVGSEVWRQFSGFMVRVIE
jgi:hypothetical protein